MNFLFILSFADKPMAGTEVKEGVKKWRKGEMRKQRSAICLLLLALLQNITPSSAQNATAISAPNHAALSYLTRPADITVAVGEPAAFRCGVPQASPNVTLTFYGSHRNYSLNCPGGHIEDIPQALDGSCDLKNGESLAVWSIKGTSFSDNGTRVVCQQSENPDAPAAILHVYDNGASYAILIGCVIGGFFGTLLVAGLLYVLLQRSDTVQECFRGRETEDDLTTIVTKE